MASAATILVETLHDDAAVTGLVGTGNSFRCYPGRIPQGDSMPAIRWHLNDSRPHRHLNGVAGISISSFTIDCVGDTYDDAYALAAAVVDALDESVTDKGGIVLQFMQAEIEAHGFYREPGASDSQDRHMVSVGAWVWHDD